MNTRTETQRLERLLLGQESFLQEVYGILAQEQERDDILRAMVLSSRGGRAVNHIPSPEPDRVFDERTIRKMCTRYRLRFLEAGAFKGDIPPQAIAALRALEERVGEPLRGFRILAPTERFKLCDSEADSLLFVPLGDGRHYLVHQWGGELNVFRKVVNWPLRGPIQLATTVLFLAMLFASVVPNTLIMGDPAAPWWGWPRFLFMVWTSMVFASFTLFGWFAFFGQFSAQAWNSRYFN